MRYLSSNDVAEILGINISTLKRWTENGTIGCSKTAGGHRKFTMQHVRDYYKNNKNSDKNLHILADVKKEIKKTKEFNKFLIKNKLTSVLIISDGDSLKNINKSARNIKNVKLIKEEGTNIYDLFKYKNVIITSTSAKNIQQRILNEKN